MKIKESLAIFLACLTITGTGMGTMSYTASATTAVEHLKLW